MFPYFLLVSEATTQVSCMPVGHGKKVHFGDALGKVQLSLACGVGRNDKLRQQTMCLCCYTFFQHGWTFVLTFNNISQTRIPQDLSSERTYARGNRTATWIYCCIFLLIFRHGFQNLASSIHFIWEKTAQAFARSATDAQEFILTLPVSPV